MLDKDKTDLEKVIPETAQCSLEEFIQNYSTNCSLDIADYLYVMCRLAGHFDNLQKKIWSRSNLDNNEQVVLNRFNSVLQKLTPYSGSKVYRVYSNSSYLEEKQLSFFKNNLNKVFEINAYLGTSSKPMEGYTECIWEIQLNNPSCNRSLRFEDLGFDGYDSEEEVIFLPCTKFKIMNVSKNTVLLQETGEEVSCILPVS